jgi:hypothetical protein
LEEVRIAKGQIERDLANAKSESERDVAKLWQAISRMDDGAKAMSSMDDVAKAMSSMEDVVKAMTRMDGEVKEAKHSNAVLYEYVMQRFETVGATRAGTLN